MEYITFLDNCRIIRIIINNKCNALSNIITFNCEKLNSDCSITLPSDYKAGFQIHRLNSAVKQYTTCMSKFALFIKQ